jgi:serine/threonine protein kinase/tetratricopeptide (TPR) repeat protein
MPATTLSHYQLGGLLGAGGMGAVYHALDTDLGRPVAIKLLRPEFAQVADRRERFLREARAAAALSHPNICTIHEIGQAGDDLFIVMQYLQGRTLAAEIAAGPLEPRRVRAIGEQLAEALSVAHRHGVVHRDLKPSNIMIDEHDAVKVLDFGLASIRDDRAAGGAVSTATRSPLTQPGQALGTVGYMAPELIRGEPAGPAVDVFALGVTLYEAATAVHPFLRGGSIQTLAAVLDEQPSSVRARNPAFPAGLDDVILTCLAKRAEYRYADGSAVRTALQESRSDVVAAHPFTPPRSVAVLPFANVTADPADDYLADGLTTEIITRLSKLKGLLVISRSATQRFRNQDMDARQIGRELNVQTVLEGDVARQGNRCRVSVELMNVNEGFCLWADKYEFVPDDLFHVQAQVSNRIARALRRRFPAAEIAPRQTPASANIEAYQRYLQGKWFYYRFNDRDNLMAIDAFRRAIAVDARYAPAHAALASACMARIEREWDSDTEQWLAVAREACERAITLDPWLSEAYSARALIALRHQQTAEAEADLRRAVAINANDDIAHSMLGRIFFERGDLLAAARAYRRALRISPDYVWCWNDLAWVHWLLGREADTERALRRALAINPVDEIARVGVATAHYFRGELDLAIDVARRAGEINPHHPFPGPVLAVALAKRGRSADAEALCDRILDGRPDDFLASAALAVVFAITGNAGRLARANDRALAIVAPRAPLNLNVAVHFAFLGFPQLARRWLQKAAGEGVRCTDVFKHNPLLHSFASEMAAANSR